MENRDHLLDFVIVSSSMLEITDNIFSVDKEHKKEQFKKKIKEVLLTSFVTYNDSFVFSNIVKIQDSVEKLNPMINLLILYKTTEDEKFLRCVFKQKEFFGESILKIIKTM